MFKEVPNVRQPKGDAKRRWFCDDDLELIVWFDENDSIIGFQLCYQAERQSKALTWLEDEGFHHTGVDDGEHKWFHDISTPVLVPDGAFEKKAVEARFNAACQSLPQNISEFVKNKIKTYGDGHALPS